MTSVYSPVGLNVKWDGISRAYVIVQPRFRGMTCGLCGTFNNNQNDDLTTKENVVETSVTAFGNSWKVNPACNDTQPSKHPCEMQIQRKATAEKLCNRLLHAPFSRCHHTVDPSDGYIASCMFDVCGCQQGTQCLCSAIAAYVHDCARQGVVIEWMNSNVMPECSEYFVFLSFSRLYFTSYFQRHNTHACKSHQNGSSSIGISVSLQCFDCFQILTLVFFFLPAIRPIPNNEMTKRGLKG